MTDLSKETLLIAIGVFLLGIGVLGEKAARGKSIQSVFRRASELSIVFYAGMMAMHFSSLELGIIAAVAIVYYAARREWDDLFRKGFRRLVCYVFRRNSPPNPQR